MQVVNRVIKSLFTIAKEKSPSIIFIDEIDGFSENRYNVATKKLFVISRDVGEGEYNRRVNTEFLVQMQGKLPKCKKKKRTIKKVY